MEKPAEGRRDAQTVVNEVMEEWLFQTPIIERSELAKRRRPKANPVEEPRSTRAICGSSLIGCSQMPS
jgi:hypothetical protein